jgi:hypothetical protein
MFELAFAVHKIDSGKAPLAISVIKLFRKSLWLRRLGGGTSGAWDYVNDHARQEAVTHYVIGEFDPVVVSSMSSKAWSGIRVSWLLEMFLQRRGNGWTGVGNHTGRRDEIKNDGTQHRHDTHNVIGLFELDVLARMLSKASTERNRRRLFDKSIVTGDPLPLVENVTPSNASIPMPVRRLELRSIMMGELAFVVVAL